VERWALLLLISLLFPFFLPLLLLLLQLHFWLTERKDRGAALLG
jgi:hypothetical protein